MKKNIQVLATIHAGDSEIIEPSIMAENMKQSLAREYVGEVTVTAYWDEEVTTSQRKNFTA